MAQGSSWELAVAVSLKNPKFEIGTNFNAAIQETVGTSTLWIKIDRTSYPQSEHVLQYNDQLLLGPSSVEVDKSETETAQVSGFEPWNASIGKIHLRNKEGLTYQYNAGDPLTFYGNGIAGGWFVPTAMKDYVLSEGIKMGLVSRHVLGSYLNSGSNPPPIGYYNFQQNGSLPYLTFKKADGVDDYGFFIDWISDYQEYLINPLDSNDLGHFAVKNGYVNDSLTKYILYGDYHKGGWRKDFAQRLKLQLKQGMPSGYIFQQNLVRSGNENRRERTLLVPYQYYRMGAKIFCDTTYHGTEFEFVEDGVYDISLQVLPMSSLRSGVSGVQYLSTDLPGYAADTWIDWTSSIQLLKSGMSNIEDPFIALKFTNAGIPGAGGIHHGDLIMYLDNMWLEHAGGVNYASTDGCLKFSRYSVWPEHESIKIEKRERDGIYHLFGKKYRHFITCKFNYVSQEFWDQFEILMSWQERGYSLNLHSYINDLPTVMTGKMFIKDYSKDSWDLGLRTFTVEFLED